MEQHAACDRRGDAAPAEIRTLEGDAERPQRQRDKEQQCGEQARIVGAAGCERGADMGDGVECGYAEIAERDVRPTAAEQRRNWSCKPDDRDVHRSDEALRDRAALRVGKAEGRAQGGAEGIGHAVRVDAVLFELVQQVGRGGGPGEPGHVARAQGAAVAAQVAEGEHGADRGAEDEAEPGPEMREGDGHRRKVEGAWWMRQRAAMVGEVGRQRWQRHRRPSLARSAVAAGDLNGRH